METALFTLFWPEATLEGTLRGFFCCFLSSSSFSNGTENVPISTGTYPKRTENVPEFKLS